MSVTIDKLKERIQEIAPDIEIDPDMNIDNSSLGQLHFIIDFERAYEKMTGSRGTDIIFNLAKEIYAWRQFDRYSS